MALSIAPPTLVEHGPMRFVIADAPSDHNLPLYIKARVPVLMWLQLCACGRVCVCLCVSLCEGGVRVCVYVCVCVCVC
jgi:hypothetical protein